MFFFKPRTGFTALCYRIEKGLNEYTSETRGNLAFLDACIMADCVAVRELGELQNHMTATEVKKYNKLCDLIEQNREQLYNDFILNLEYNHYKLTTIDLPLYKDSGGASNSFNEDNLVDPDFLDVISNIVNVKTNQKSVNNGVGPNPCEQFNSLINEIKPLAISKPQKTKSKNLKKGVEMISRYLDAFNAEVFPQYVDQVETKPTLEMMERLLKFEILAVLKNVNGPKRN